MQERVCEINPPVAQACNMQPGWTMWDLYQKFWQPFGGLLVDMERAGMLVDRCFTFLPLCSVPDAS